MSIAGGAPTPSPGKNCKKGGRLPGLPEFSFARLKQNMRAKDSRPCGVSRASRQNPSSPLPRNCRFRAIGASLRRELCKGSAGIMVRPIASLPRPEKSLPKSRIGCGNSLMLSLRQTALARPCSGPRQTRRQACLPRKPLVPSINKSQLTNPLRSSNKSPPVF